MQRALSDLIQVRCHVNAQVIYLVSKRDTLQIVTIGTGRRMLFVVTGIGCGNDL